MIPSLLPAFLGGGPHRRADAPPRTPEGDFVSALLKAFGGAGSMPVAPENGFSDPATVLRGAEQDESAQAATIDPFGHGDIAAEREGEPVRPATGGTSGTSFSGAEAVASASPDPYSTLVRASGGEPSATAKPEPGASATPSSRLWNAEGVEFRAASLPRSVSDAGVPTRFARVREPEPSALHPAGPLAGLRASVMSVSHSFMAVPTTDPAGEAHVDLGHLDDPPLTSARESREAAPQGTEGALSFADAPVSPGPTDVGVADRSWKRLDPVLRSKLARVITRMESEYGHDVRLIEGYRSPARQSHLFAQGRSRPGPVVTWTLDSEHLGGRAVDVQVDGSFEGTPGYARLQQVAAEEGLRTLGMRDPGHLELGRSPTPASASAASWQEALLSQQEAPAPAVSRARDSIARPARVAQVSRLADVASAARVARVAKPGHYGSVPPPESGAPRDAKPAGSGTEGPTPLMIPQPEPRQPVAPVRMGATFADRTGQAPAHDEGAANRGGRSVSRAGEPTPAQGVESEPGAQTRAAALEILGAGTDGVVDRAGPVRSTEGGLDSMSRVERALQARAIAETALPPRIAVRFDGAGPIEQVRVGLLGMAVEADLDVADAETAALIRSRVAELHGALESRGLELGSLGVNSAATDPSLDALSGGRSATSELLRSLLSTSGADAGRDDSDRSRWNRQTTHDDGSASDRPRRETGKEE